MKSQNTDYKIFFTKFLYQFSSPQQKCVNYYEN